MKYLTECLHIRIFKHAKLNASGPVFVQCTISKISPPFVIDAPSLPEPFFKSIIHMKILQTPLHSESIGL